MLRAAGPRDVDLHQNRREALGGVCDLDCLAAGAAALAPRHAAEERLGLMEEALHAVVELEPAGLHVRGEELDAEELAVVGDGFADRVDDFHIFF